MDACRLIFCAVAVLAGLATAGCGGNDADDPSASVDPDLRPEALEPVVLPPAPSAAQVLANEASGFTCAEGAVTCVQVQSTGATAQDRVAVTFGQAFRAQDLLAEQSLVARDAAGRAVPLQMDGVSTRPDGSVRMAVLTAQLADLQAGERRVVNLFRTAAVASVTVPPPAPATGLEMAATVYRPQLSLLTLGNRNGHTPGTPFLEGEQVTLVLQRANQSAERYTVTVTGDMVGGAFTHLTRIAEALKARIEANPQSAFLPQKPGGGFENLWITTRAPDGGPFTVSVDYSGLASTRVEQLIAYRAPVVYRASTQKALSAALSRGGRMHLQGPLAHEPTLVLPFTDDQGRSHPQLTARVHARVLDGGQRVRHDLVLENNWAYNPEPGNLTYALTVRLDGRVVLDQPAFTHYHHARWHRHIWQGSEVQAQVHHHMPYLMASGVIWNYDLSLPIPERVLADEATRLAAAPTGLMGSGFLTPYFGTTGGRHEIGPYPRWTALYLITQDDRARRSMMVHADIAGGVPIHYRDAASDQPLDLERHPGVTTLFGQSSPADALPAMVDKESIWSPDIAHQGSFAFVPYLISGDAYHLDEVMFWASWNLATYNPGYRGQGQGLLHSEQVRGQAWGLRSLGEAARAVPDAHPMKAYFESRLANNLAWYKAKYREGGDTSPLGAMSNPYDTTTIGPWQGDFFGLVVSQLAQDGHADARAVFEWMSRFNVGRFMHEQDAGYCVAKAPAYYVAIKNSNGTYIDNWRDLFQRNWPGVTCSADLPLDPSSYPDSSLGYAANARAMLASSANAGHAEALQVYRDWVTRTPRIRDAFLQDPTWAVVPYWP